MSNSITDSLVLVDTDEIALDETAGEQTFRVEGDTSPATLSNTPFGTATPPPDGGKVHLLGNDDDDTVTVNYNDAAGGCVGNFTSITLGKGAICSFMYSLSLNRYVLITKSI